MENNDINVLINKVAIEKRLCSRCDEEKPLDDFYKRNATSYFRQCKNCIKDSKPVKEKKPSRWLQIPEETRLLIKEKLADRNVKIHDVADEFGINYPNLCYYIRQGYVQAAGVKN